MKDELNRLCEWVDGIAESLAVPEEIRETRSAIDGPRVRMLAALGEIERELGRLEARAESEVRT